MIVAAVIFFFLIFFGGNYAIYRTVVYAFSLTDSTVLLSLKIIFIVLMVSFPMMQFFASTNFSLITRVLYVGSSIWLGTLFWLSLATIFFWSVYGVMHVVVPSLNILMVAKLLLIGALCTSAYGVWHSFQIQVKSETIEIANLPNI